MIGFFVLANQPSFWLSLFMANVAGGFSYLAVHAVLGEMLKHGKGLVLMSFSLGITLIAALNVCLRRLAS